MSSDSDLTPNTGPDPAPDPDLAPAPATAPAAPTADVAAGAEDPGAQAPVLDPFAPPGGPVEPPAPRSKAQRKRLWQVGAAALLTVVTGAATAVAVTQPDRTDLPGLATPNDGRYVFPELTLPPLPVGASAPADSKTKAHAADLRALLLPLPKGAVGTGPSAAPSTSPSASASASTSASASASGSASASDSPSASPVASLPPVVGRWVPCDKDAMLAVDDKYSLRLTTAACRAAAAQGWTAKDGTRTELRLMRFGSGYDAADFYSRASMMSSTKDIAGTRPNTGNTEYPVVSGGQLEVRNATETAGDLPTGRLAWLQSGDVVAVIQLTNPKGVPLQSFRQVIALQSELLG
ncbi:hypothetical protein [Streptomyces sp. TLI_171]|uniref:hypothetical protein n=1 Tax=Streptomyces sp. TLI_171 TaxID=1938859 RepID=UPI000C1A0C7E|nr:hypothetical protein [Streptomyces sp. TLI_171]RKE20406.1 hypothetical protein BX266_3763 [Streptomyces sp. TLI_171]